MEWSFNMAHFEPITKYAAAGLPIPKRKTRLSAGYDFVVAEDTLVEPWIFHMEKLQPIRQEMTTDPKTLDDVAKITKATKAKPTLVPTGMKCFLADNQYLELSVRSSCPLKHWLMLANGVGIIDADYYNNPDNEGHIYFQIINLTLFHIILPPRIIFACLRINNNHFILLNKQRNSKLITSF